MIKPGLCGCPLRTGFLLELPGHLLRQFLVAPPGVLAEWEHWLARPDMPGSYKACGAHSCNTVGYKLVIHLNSPHENPTQIRLHCIFLLATCATSHGALVATQSPAHQILRCSLSLEMGCRRFLSSIRQAALKPTALSRLTKSDWEPHLLMSSLNLPSFG